MRESREGPGKESSGGPQWAPARCRPRSVGPAAVLTSLQRSGGERSTPPSLERRLVYTWSPHEHNVAARGPPAAKESREFGSGRRFAVACGAHRGRPRSAPRISAQRTAPARHVHARERRMRRVRGACKLVRHCLCRDPGRDRERRDRGAGGGGIRGVLAADQRFLVRAPMRAERNPTEFKVGPTEFRLPHGIPLGGFRPPRARAGFR